MSPFLVVVFLASILAGATASIAGFGIGSILTPLLALRLATPVAVAAVAVPHAVATVFRAWRLRRAVDWPVFRRFGIWSAAGGLAGALLFSRLGGNALTRVLGALLVLTAISTLTGWATRVHVPRWAAWVLGILSGFFGGVVGNQGGLRAGALIGLGLTSTAFVATSTMTGVIVDVVRTPIYVAREGGAVADAWILVAASTVGVVVGTLLGERMLFGLSPDRFRRLVAALIGVLGLWLLLFAGR
ncbi:MAG TPA: sulfite exporter TauE/SafE family protein [Gemmatimonadaceae bacterium]|nr:sulfite exporter TauE/SafE family protein [Gemmatimonadaceae bacterium]